MKWAKRVITLVFALIGWAMSFALVAYLAYGEGEISARQSDAQFFYYHCTHPDEHFTFGTSSKKYSCRETYTL